MNSRKVTPLAKEGGTLCDDCGILDQCSCIAELHLDVRVLGYSS